MTIAYWAVVVAGAVTLLVEAYRQFTAPDDIHTHDRYPILKSVNLDDLCTSGELVRGFMTYASLYVGAYAVILGSTEVFEIVAAGAGESGSDEAIQNLVVGARDFAEDSGAVVAPADAFDLGKPIFVSAAIIAALSMGIFAPVEKIVRSYAHWIAAVPRGVYRVISGLKRVDYAKLGRRGRSPTLNDFDAKRASFPEDAIGAETLKDIHASLRAYDVVQPAVTGPLRERLFTAYMPSSLEALVAQQDKENDELNEALRNLTDDPGDLQRFQMLAAQACNNMQALFALLYIRNKKAADTSLVKGPTSQVIEQLQNDRDPAYHALSGALFIMIIAVLILYPLTYWLTIYGAHPGFYYSCADLGLEPPRCMENGENPALPPFSTVLGFIRAETMLAAMQNFLIFLICSSTALLSREASQEYGHWRTWKLSALPPFMKLFQHSLFPGVVAVIICVIIKLIEYQVTVDVDGSFNTFVRDNWQFCLMNFVFGFAIAVVLFLITDQHDNLSAPKTIMLSLVGISPYVVWAAFVQSLNLQNPTDLLTWVWMTREVFLLSIPAVCFAVAYAVFIEWSEDTEAVA